MLPLPVEANGISPGLFFASAARSLAELTGVSGLTTRIVVGRTTSVIGAKSRGEWCDGWVANRKPACSDAA